MNTTKTKRRIDRILISFICVFFLIGLLCSPAFAKVLDVPLVTQEQDQWCWAGVSKATLDFYGFNINQCTIAEYTRTTATWHDFGSTNCCADASQGCNYWNYNWGYAGSINSILQNWGVSNYGYGAALSIDEITEQIDGNRPFIIRWGWTTGGGHFLVGHGIDDNGMVNYMNPWPGEGLTTALYAWVVSGSNHTWTHTNILTASPPCIDTILPTSRSFDRSFGTGNISVKASSNDCFWAATSNDDWITITSGSSGTGNGMVTYSVAANATSSTRTGTITISGKTFTVTQSGVWAQKSDFNGDGKPDILWRNASTGENYVWYMDGVTVLGGGNLPTVADQNWKIVGVADFNNDGKPDIIWRNVYTGENYAWYMDGVTVLGGGNLPTVADQNWKVVGVADFNNDNKPDILWRNAATGANYVWYMDDVTVLGGGNPPTVADQNWKVVAVKDFNNDDKSDILWRNAATGDNYVWYLNGVTVLGGGNLPTVADQNWKVVGVGDFNNDGKPDILWRYATTGDNYVWYMDGVTVLGGSSLPTVADQNWTTVP
jgi:hypothetical protein